MLVNTLSELTGEELTVQFEVASRDELEQGPEIDQDEREISSRKSEAKQAISAQKNAKNRAESNLNPSYDFSSFVIGDNSAFAYNASLAIAKNPGSSYNPCLIYGGVGLGKTHLLSSIGNYILDNTPELKVMYVTAEMFTNEFIESIGSQRTQHFKNKFRKVGALIDDITFSRQDSPRGALPFNSLSAKKTDGLHLRPSDRAEEHHRPPTHGTSADCASTSSRRTTRRGWRSSRSSSRRTSIVKILLHRHQRRHQRP